MSDEGAHGQRLEDRVGGLLSLTGTVSPGVLEAVFRMSPLPVVLTASRQDNPILFCNPAFSVLTGYTLDEIIGRNCRFLQGEASDETVMRKLSEAVSGAKEIQVELWNYRKDGTRFWNSMFVGPIHDDAGNLLYFLGSQLDATARKELDEARYLAQRMDTLGSTAAGVAHEVNNLMSVVVGSVEGMRSEELSARQAVRLDRIDWAAQSTARLMRQMLSFSSRRDKATSVADLNDIVRNLDRVLGQIAGAQHPVTFELEDTFLFARLDLGELELAIVNLVRNAADASPPGSGIVLSTRGNDLTVEVVVTDRGNGMPPEIAERATEAFFTTKGDGKGTGLGLSMVTGFCEHHQGKMVIDTAAGQGTSVRLVFPRNAPPPPDRSHFREPVQARPSWPPTEAR